jgi:hypothetical protein
MAVQTGLGHENSDSLFHKVVPGAGRKNG